MDKYRKTRLFDVDFYTNKGKAKAVKDTLKAQMTKSQQFMIAKYDCYKHNDGYLKPYMQYALVSTSHLKAILEQDRNLCEALTEGRDFCRVFFDVEKEGVKLKDPLEVVKEKILSALPDALMNISGSHKVYDDGRERYSYHIILGNYHAESLDDFTAIKAFCLSHKEHGFDETVYRRDGLLKFMNQSKGDKRVVQAYISGSEEILDHTVTHQTLGKTVSQHIVEVTNLQKYLEKAITKGKKNTMKEHLENPNAKKIKLEDVDTFLKMNLPTPTDLDIYQDPPLKLLQYLPNYPRYHQHQWSHKICTRIARWCKYVGISWDDFWKWNQQKDDSEKRKHRYWNYWCSIDLVKYPVSSKLVSTYLTCYVYNKDISKSHPVRQMIASYNTQFNHKSDKRHLDVEDHEKAARHKAVIMHVPLGGAKSHSSMKWLEKHIGKNPAAIILWMTCRVALAKEQRGRINELTGCSFWKYYDDLTRKQKEDPNRPQEQYFTLLKSFDPENECVKDMDGTWTLFTERLRGAKKVVFLDGFITQITTGFLADLNETPYIAGSAIPPPPRKMVLCDCSEYIYDQIEKCLARGEKIFIGTGAKGKKKVTPESSVEHIVSTVLKGHPTWKLGVEILAYHGDTKEAKRDLEKGAVNVWGDPQVRDVVGNAALSIGIDFSPSPEELASGKIVQFDRVFGILQPSCISPRDFFQLLYRVRQPKSDTFTVYLAKPLSEGWKRKRKVKRALPSSHIYDNLVKRVETELHAANSLAYKQMFKKFCEWMNIEIVEGIETLTDEEKAAVGNTFDWSHNMFAWHHFEDISKETYETYRDLLQESEMTVAMFLEMKKHEFKNLVPSEQQEVAWNDEKHLVYALTSLIRHEENISNARFRPVMQTQIIYDFYKANNMSYGDKIPLNAVCNTPFDVIQRAFGFHNALTTYAMHLFSKLLNIYFESRVLYKDYTQSSSGKQYAWVSETADIGKLYTTIKDYREQLRRELLFGDDTDDEV
ncbi:hypothetical protein HDV00_009889 [Rhizophlyctis rosea]|nr:hypothetical protein HDV00_009889 [Rhizophlyctis rosea]